MSSSQNNGNHDSQSECPDCRQKYISESSNQSQSSQSESKQRMIIIPPRRDPQKQSTDTEQVHSTLNMLKTEIENLKLSNMQKDKVIDDLRKEMEHKMTHYMIYGEINKQADQINRLKASISTQNVTAGRSLQEDLIRELTRYQYHQYSQRPTPLVEKKPRPKTQSSYDNYSSLRQKYGEKTEASVRKNRNPNGSEYFPTSKPIFNISWSKQRIQELQRKIIQYQNQMKWMLNFIGVFVRSVEILAFTKYREYILVPEWGYKKKAKTCWRYLKHLLHWIYSDPCGAMPISNRNNDYLKAS